MKKRIIFVDDEPNVLAGLRRMLRGFRNEWEMEFAPGGAVALARMDESPFDAIVTDIKMPKMDGVELLGEVLHRHPATVRIILSGQADQEAVQRSLKRTHQFLTKPCNPDVLKATVKRACALRDKLANESLVRLVSQVTTLPSLPEVYNQLLTELQSPEPSLKRVAELISKDLAMTAKLLQLVNSSFFGLPRRIEDPAHAVSLLGLKILKPVALSAGIFAQFVGTRIGEHTIEDFSNHGVAVSKCACLVAEEEGADKECVDDSVLAGLIHDVGQLILASRLSEQYCDVVRAAKQEEKPLRDCEIERFGADHADVGAYLLGLWGLPDSIVEAVAYHHRPSESPVDQFGPITAVHVANVLINQTKACGLSTHVQEVDEEHLRRLGAEDKLPKWRETVEQKLAEWEVT